jgi:hypothetical protein
LGGMDTEKDFVPVGAFKLLPAPPGTCPECAVAHEPEMPHNAQSLHYQYHFYGRHGRWPDWRDAMAHCTQQMKTVWINRLTLMGVDVEGGKVNPDKKEPPAV